MKSDEEIFKETTVFEEKHGRVGKETKTAENHQKSWIKQKKSSKFWKPRESDSVLERDTQEKMILLQSENKYGQNRKFIKQ